MYLNAFWIDAFQSWDVILGGGVLQHRKLDHPIVTIDQTIKH